MQCKCTYSSISHFYLRAVCLLGYLSYVILYNYMVYPIVLKLVHVFIVHTRFIEVVLIVKKIFAGR